MTKTDDEHVAAQQGAHPAATDGTALTPPLTRRTFLAGTGAAAAATLAGSATAFAAGGANPIYRIHPAIGIARMGNAPEYFIGPEVPGYAPLNEAPGTAVPPYKNASGQFKRQAARFRVFEYAMVNGALTPVREVTLATPGVVGIKWRVHLANKKSSFYELDGGAGENRPPAPRRNAAVADRRSLESDFGPRAISGAGLGPVEFKLGTSDDPASETAPRKPDGTPVIDYLGELRTDAEGRLLVLGGRGQSGYNTETQPPLPHWANNDNWFDDASDGPVTCVVTIKDGGAARDVPLDAAGGAWVLCTPPDFAPGIWASVSGYDLLLDLAAREISIPGDNALYRAGGPLADLPALQQQLGAGQFTFRPSFPDHIQPMLVAAYNLWWVDDLVTARHNTLLSPALADPGPASAAARKKVLSFTRPPEGTDPTGTATMPKNFGDDPYIGQMPETKKHQPMTKLQFELLRQWAAGNFTTTSAAPAPAISPHGLDRAALENTSGGPFYPGIEFGWQLRHPGLYLEPFRLDLNAPSGFWDEASAGVTIGPGYFSRQMAVPWQADFNDCRNEGGYAWWPAKRPTQALPTKTAKQRVEWARPTNRFAGGNKESAREDMVRNWYKFALVLEDGDLYVEKERDPRIV